MTPRRSVTSKATAVPSRPAVQSTSSSGPAQANDITAPLCPTRVRAGAPVSGSRSSTSSSSATARWRPSGDHEASVRLPSPSGQLCERGARDLASCTRRSRRSSRLRTTAILEPSGETARTVPGISRNSAFFSLMSSTSPGPPNADPVLTVVPSGHTRKVSSRRLCSGQATERRTSPFRSATTTCELVANTSSRSVVQVTELFMRAGSKSRPSCSATSPSPNRPTSRPSALSSRTTWTSSE